MSGANAPPAAFNPRAIAPLREPAGVTPWSGLSTAVKTDLWNEGFPPKVVNAFLATSNANNAVVISRTPGAAALGYIERRFDLKGFYNKTKSCGWGPMAGFVCMTPWFNKKGNDPDAVNRNVGYMVKFVTSFVQIAGPGREAFARLRVPQSRLAELATLLPDTLLPDLRQPQAAGTTKIPGFAWDNNATCVMEYLLVKFDGAAAPPASAADPAWNLLCGNIWLKGDNAWVRRDANRDWLTNPEAGWDQRAPSQAVRDEIAIAIDGYYAWEVTLEAAPEQAARDAALAALRQAVPSFANVAVSAADATQYWPVMGCLNPFPPYTLGSTRPRPMAPPANPNPPLTPAQKAAAEAADAVPATDFRNAISGDFDLFAVWPRTGNLLAGNDAPIMALQRWSEMPEGSQSPRVEVRGANAPPLNLSLRSGARLMGLVTGKAFSRCLAASPNVLIEFVPDLIATEESGELGNINQAVYAVANQLNSQVYLYYNTPDASRVGDSGFVRAAVNNAFHSDEGGRPGTTGIDLPVAVFAPENLEMDPVAMNGVNVSLGTRAKVAKTCAEFLKLIMAMKGGCLVPIQAAWLAVLMEEAAVTAGMRAGMRELVLGPLPAGADYTAGQLLAYANLLTALRGVFGAYRQGDGGKGGEFANSIPRTAVNQNLFTPFDALAVPAAPPVPQVPPAAG